MKIMWMILLMVMESLAWSLLHEREFSTKTKIRIIVILSLHVCLSEKVYCLSSFEIIHSGSVSTQPFLGLARLNVDNLNPIQAHLKSDEFSKPYYVS